MKEMLNGLMGDAKFLLRGGVSVMAIWFVIWSWVRTKSAVPTVGAILVGAVVMWGVANLSVLRDEVGEDLTNNGAGEGTRRGRDSALVPVGDDHVIVTWPSSSPEGHG